MSELRSKIIVKVLNFVLVSYLSPIYGTKYVNRCSQLQKLLRNFRSFVYKFPIFKGREHKSFFNETGQEEGN